MVWSLSKYRQPLNMSKIQTLFWHILGHARNTKKKKYILIIDDVQAWNIDLQKKNNHTLVDGLLFDFHICQIYVIFPLSYVFVWAIFSIYFTYIKY